MRKYVSLLAVLALLMVGLVPTFAQDATPTEEPTMEVTEEPTMEVTEEPTAEVTEMPTEEMTEEGEDMGEDMDDEEMMQPLTHVRIHHLAADGPPVDLYVNGEIIVDSLAFPTSSQWLNIPAGTYEIAVAPENTSIDQSIIGPATFTFDESVWYNVAAVGSVASESVSPAIFVEQLGTPLGDETTSRLTVFHAIEGGPTIDVLADGEPLISDLAFPNELDGNDGAYTVDIPAGTYELSIYASEDETQVLDLGEFTLEPGTTYFVAAVGTPDSPSFATVAVSDAQMAENMGLEPMPEAEDNTIAGILTARSQDDVPDFITLLAAVQAAGLVDTLSDADASYTVFAPSDAAFSAALSNLGMTSDELLADTDTLTSILLYHVVEGSVMAESVMSMDGQSVTTLNGADITISVTESGVVINDTANVVATDIVASNGVIHVIDSVLLPPMSDDMSDDSTMDDTSEDTEMDAVEETPTEEAGDS